MLNKIKRHHYALLAFLIALSSIGIFWYKSDEQKTLLEIRDYQEASDYGKLIELMEENFFWLSERRDFSPHRVLTWKAPFDNEKRKGEAIIRVALYDKLLAGFVAFFKNSPEEGFIWLLAVDKNFRKRKIGEELMKNAIQELKEKNVKYISISTRSINTPALTLYKKLGFMEAYTNERGIVTLVLRKL